MQLDLAEFARMAVWLHWNGLRMTITTPALSVSERMSISRQKETLTGGGL